MRERERIRLSILVLVANVGVDQRPLSNVELGARYGEFCLGRIPPPSVTELQGDQGGLRLDFVDFDSGVLI